MEQPQNPYNDSHESYLNRAWKEDYTNAETFFQDSAYCGGQRKGWDEGYKSGTERYFNVENENDCADTLYTYLAALQLKIAKEFGTESVMHEVLESFFFNLQEAPVPADAPYRREPSGRIEEHQHIDGVWVQPHSWADELN